MHKQLSAGCFYGKTLKKYESAGLMLTESVYRPRTKIAHHSHTNPYFCVTLRGSYQEMHGNKRRGCKPSTLVFHPADEIHANQFLDQGGHLFRLEIPSSWIERIHPYSSALKHAAEFNGGPLVCLVTKLYRECDQPDSVSPLAVEGLALEIIAEMSRSKMPKERTPPGWVNRARDFLHEHFAEKLNPGAIAMLLDVHPVHLARTFRQTHGCTMGEYLRQRRIEIAARYLSTCDTSIADISTMIGFADQSHFSKNFKRRTGFTPAQYRMIFRGR
jgi:AraC family transcriptional regulator